MKKINYWAVLVAIAVTFTASAVWYAAFAHQYFELRGIDPNDQAATAMSAWQVLIILGRHLVVTLVMAYIFVRIGITTLKDGLGMGFLFWLGFPAVLLVGSIASDKVPFELAAIHGGDWLIKLLIIGIILAVWRKKARKAA
jgi:hypothetical protein